MTRKPEVPLLIQRRSSMNTRHVTIAQGWFVGAFAIAIAAVLAAASFAVDDTASKKAAQFRDNMRKQLDTVERRLKSVQANLRAESEQAEKSLREKLYGNRSVPPSGANFAGKGLMIVKHVAIPGHLRMLVIHEGACCEPCGLLS
jgi:hypothetical protein